MIPMKSATSGSGNFFSSKLNKIQNGLEERGIDWNRENHLPVDKMIQTIDKTLEENEQLFHWIHPTKQLQIQKNNNKLRETRQSLINLVDTYKMMQVLQYPLPMTIKQVLPTSRNIKRYQQTTHKSDQQSTSQTSQQPSQQSIQQSNQKSSRNFQQLIQQFLERIAEFQEKLSQIKLQVEQLPNSVKNVQQDVGRLKRNVEQREQLNKNNQKYSQPVSAKSAHNN